MATYYYTNSATTSEWNSWNDNATTANAYGFDNPNTWNAWQSQRDWNGTVTIWATWSNSSYYLDNKNNPFLYHPIETEEQEKERLKLEEEARKQRKEQARLLEEARKAAEQKARELLLSHLNEAQKESFVKNELFLVNCPSGKIYEIKKGYSRNIRELDETGKHKRTLCFHPVMYEKLPDYDVVLAQKFMLELNEREALQVANFS